MWYSSLNTSLTFKDGRIELKITCSILRLYRQYSDKRRQMIQGRYKDHKSAGATFVDVEKSEVNFNKTPSSDRRKKCLVVKNKLKALFLIGLRCSTTGHVPSTVAFSLQIKVIPYVLI